MGSVARCCSNGRIQLQLEAQPRTPAIWAASLPLFLGRRLLPKSSPSPPPSGRRLPFRPICKRRMSAQADPRFAPLPTAQSEADAGADGYQFRLVSYNILAQAIKVE
uniref:Endonuclease/exonuclease/phosphatase domain-containing protein n=1 Tax=Aegilops tauschii TaxID=37682 RepID=M8C4C1_AEGTA